MVKIEVIEEKYANTYYIGTDEEVIIVDPAVNIKTTKFMLNKYFANAKIVGIFLTHGHYDHFITLNSHLKEFNPNIYLHKNAYLKLNDLVASCANLFGETKITTNALNLIFVHHLQLIKFNTFNVVVHYTPGHTNCSVVFEIENNLITGDTLFNNGVGRCDLPTGNNILLNQSIKYLLENLNSKLNLSSNIYPGHGEKSNIEDEIKYNYYYNRIK